MAEIDEVEIIGGEPRNPPLFRLGVGVDLLVYTPEEYERLKREGTSFIECVEREGVTIYARREG